MRKGALAVSASIRSVAVGFGMLVETLRGGKGLLTFHAAMGADREVNLLMLFQVLRNRESLIANFTGILLLSSVHLQMFLQTVLLVEGS